MTRLRLKRVSVTKAIMLLVLTSLALPFFVLSVSVSSNAFSGTVYASSGVPVPYAAVAATSDKGFETAATDINGHYSMTSGLPAGNYTLTVVSNGYIEFKVENLTVTVGGTTIENPYMHASGGISGKITDVLTHLGLNNVTVSAISSDGKYGWGGFTDILGNYTIVTNMATGTYNVTVLFPKGHVSNTLSSISVTEGAITTAHDMALDHSGMISGTVTNTSSYPLANVTVIAVSSTAVGTATTDASGHYIISDGLTTGTYTVTATIAGGFAMPQVGVPVVEGQETSNINFTMSTFAITPSGTIKGKVTDAGNSPIAYALVTAEGQNTLSSKDAHTDTSGNYIISTGLPTDIYNVTASAPGYSPLSQNVSVTVNTVSQADFNLIRIPPEQSGTISGTVTGDANPLVPEFQSPLIALLFLTLAAVVIAKSSNRKHRPC